jgi:hypothetical protein
MKRTATGDCPSAIVSLLGHDGECLGTGFFVSRRLIMTCEHVVMGTSTILAQRLVGGEPSACRLLETDSDRDLAILRLEKGDEEGEPIRPLRGLYPDLLRQFDGRLTSIGVEANTGKPLRLDNLTLRLVVGSLGAETDVVREAQITGGAPHGLSGAPVFAMTPGAARPCVGMMILGGSESGQSLLRGPDAMVRLWQRAGVEDEIACLAAADVLARPSERISWGRSRVLPRSPARAMGAPSLALANPLPAEVDHARPIAIEPGIANLHGGARTAEFTLASLPATAEPEQPRPRGRRTMAACLLLASAAAGLTTGALRKIYPPAAPPPAWVANELFPGVRELLGFAEDLEQFSRVYLLPPKNYLGHQQQVADLNQPIQLYNCTSDYLSVGKNFFRDRMATLAPESLKDLVVRISEARFVPKYTQVVYLPPLIGPPLLGQPSATEKLKREFREVATTWSENATQLDGPVREARTYLAELEEGLLHSVGVSVPRCPP